MKELAVGRSGESTPKRGTGKYKGPEAGTCPAQFRNSQEATVSGARWEEELKTGKVVVGHAGPLGHNKNSAFVLWEQRTAIGGFNKLLCFFTDPVFISTCKPAFA